MALVPMGGQGNTHPARNNNGLGMVGGVGCEYGSCVRWALPDHQMEKQEGPLALLLQHLAVGAAQRTAGQHHRAGCPVECIAQSLQPQHSILILQALMMIPHLDNSLLRVEVISVQKLREWHPHT